MKLIKPQFQLLRSHSHFTYKTIKNNHPVTITAFFNGWHSGHIIAHFHPPSTAIKKSIFLVILKSVNHNVTKVKGFSPLLKFLMLI